MKTIKKNVYYCDYCKKRSLSGWHMRNHELRCTANPERVCRICERESLSDLIEYFKGRFTLAPVFLGDHEGNVYGDTFEVIWKGEPVTLDEVRKRVGDCPNCIFAIIRQCKFNHHFFNKEKQFEFDYKKELALELAGRNEENPFDT